MPAPPWPHRPELAQAHGGQPASARLWPILGWAAASVAAFPAAPASAQVTAEVALQSDYRVRGFSISGEQPVAAITLGYDDPSGAYVSGTVVGAVRHDEPGIVSLQGGAGYARRVSPDISIDGGISRFEYFSAYGSARDYHYTEFYIGVATRNIAARVRYSPDYVRAGTETIYLEAGGGVEIAQNWLVSAHAGALQYLDERPGYLPQRRYDWRLGLTRRIGAYGVHLELSGRIVRTNPQPPGRSRPGGDRTGLIVSLTRAL